MSGPDIALKHWISQMHHRDLLAYAERQRATELALAARAETRRPGITEARSAIAAVLFRAGSWLMPAAMPERRAYPR